MHNVHESWHILCNQNYKVRIAVVSYLLYNHCSDKILIIKAIALFHPLLFVNLQRQPVFSEPLFVIALYNRV